MEKDRRLHGRLLYTLTSSPRPLTVPRNVFRQTTPRPPDQNVRPDPLYREGGVETSVRIHRRTDDPGRVKRRTIVVNKPRRVPSSTLPSSSSTKSSVPKTSVPGLLVWNTSKDRSVSSTSPPPPGRSSLSLRKRNKGCGRRIKRRSGFPVFPSGHGRLVDVYDGRRGGTDRSQNGEGVESSLHPSGTRRTYSGSVRLFGLVDRVGVSSSLRIFPQVSDFNPLPPDEGRGVTHD